MSIDDELKAYEVFLDTVDTYIDQKIAPGLKQSAAEEVKGAKLVGAVRAGVEPASRRYQVLLASVMKLKSRTEMKLKLDKFYTAGTGNFRDLADELYAELGEAGSFKTNGTKEAKAFKKAYKTKVKLIAALSEDAKQRRLGSVKANEALTAYHQASVISSAIFRSRYYISGSMLNQGSMRHTIGSFEAKFKRAWELLEIAREAGAPDEKLLKYEAAIGTFEGRFEVQEKRRSAIGSKSDQMGESMVFIDDNADWVAVVPMLERLGAKLRRTGSAMSEADRTAMLRNCIALEKGKPKISPKLEPGVMVPKNSALREAVEEGVEVPVDDTAAWRQAGTWFFFTAPAFARSLTDLSRYLTEGHQADFEDHDSDGEVLPQFDSWIQPATRAIAAFQPLLERAQALQREGTDLPAFEAARDAMIDQRAGLLRGLSEASAAFGSSPNPFDKSEDESAWREYALSTSIIQGKLYDRIGAVEGYLGEL
ncbi:MAG: hypothetical protein ACI8S6_003039 [Myxococcota bacterium]|jgi:hypothetical protein